MDTRNLGDLYGLPALDWAAVVARLDGGISQAPGTGGPDHHTCWLTTLDVDGGPHGAATAPSTVEPGGATRWTF